MRLIDANELMEHVWRDRLDSREAIAKMVENSPTISDCITLNDLYNIRDKIFSAECGQTYLRIDGEEYSSDIGYAFDGINIFFDVLEKRLLRGVMQNDKA
jgi:hypothetical protein